MRPALPGPGRLAPAAAALEARYGLRLAPGALEKIRFHLELLAKWNRAVPLVGRLSPIELLEKGFFEAFWAAGALPSGAAVGDVGSGAGFPGLAMKLHRPDLRMALIEPNLKKVLFLREAARGMELDVETFHGRGEDFPWPGTDFAAMRGLKPPPGLPAALERAGTRLLLLHGIETAPGLERFEVVESRLQPGSRARRATICAPRAERRDH